MIYIAINSLNNTVSTSCMKSILELLKLFRNNNIKSIYKINDKLIDNEEIIEDFINLKYTYLLYVDQAITFNPNDIYEFIKNNKSFYTPFCKNNIKETINKFTKYISLEKESKTEPERIGILLVRDTIIKEYTNVKSTESPIIKLTSFVEKYTDIKISYIENYKYSGSFMSLLKFTD